MLNVGTVVTEGDNSRTKWTVLGFLGKGTCCEVYEIQSNSPPHTKAALKVYKEGLKYERAHDGEVLLLEIVTRANGVCKYLVKTIADFDYDEHLPCIVQELLDLDLRQLMGKVQGSSLSMWLIQKLVCDILRGLHHLHKSGFVHGDMKPTNLMWSPSDYCMKVIDFSLSYHVQDDSVGMIQSQGYRAPETECWNAFCSKPPDSIVDDVSKAPPQKDYSGLLDHDAMPDVIDPGGGNAWLPGSAHADQNCPVSRVDISKSGRSGCDFNIRDNHSREATHQGAGLKTGSETPVEPAANQELARTLLLEAELWHSGSGHCPLPSRAADMWSVGCVILEVLHGTKVFTASKLTKIQQGQREGKHLSECIIQTIDDTVQENNKVYETRDLSLLRNFLTRCLAVDPEQRVSAEEALQHEFFTAKYIPSFQDLCILHSPIICLLNVVEGDDLKDSQKYEDLQIDLQEECQKYGHLVHFVIPKTGPGAGKVYMEYETWQQAQLAYSKLCRRTYNRHTVIVSYFPTDDFRSQNYF